MSVAGRTVAIMMETTSSNPERRKGTPATDTVAYSLTPKLAGAGPLGPKPPFPLCLPVSPNYVHWGVQLSLSQ